VRGSSFRIGSVPFHPLRSIDRTPVGSSLDSSLLSTIIIIIIIIVVVVVR
jgi:hypothetical protein